MPSALLQPMDCASSSALSRMRKKIFSLSPNRFLSYPQTGFQLETSEKIKKKSCAQAASLQRPPLTLSPASRPAPKGRRPPPAAASPACSGGSGQGWASRDMATVPTLPTVPTAGLGLPPGSAAGSSRLGPAGSRRPRVRQGRGLGAASKWRPRLTATTWWTLKLTMSQCPGCGESGWHLGLCWEKGDCRTREGSCLGAPALLRPGRGSPGSGRHGAAGGSPGRATEMVMGQGHV